MDGKNIINGDAVEETARSATVFRRAGHTVGDESLTEGLTSAREGFDSEEKGLQPGGAWLEQILSGADGKSQS